MSACLGSDDKMFKPRIPKTDDINDINNDEISKRLSALKKEISSLKSSEIFGNTFCFDDIVEILEKENTSLSKLLDYEETIKATKLEEEKLILSREKDEEKHFISVCSDYVKNESFVKGEAVDNAQEMLLKLEVLHRKLVSLLKKFAHKNFPVAEEKSVKPTTNRRYPQSSKQTKSVLHILKLLLPELNPRDADNLEQRILNVEELMPNEAIDFLLSANIIEKCPDNVKCIKLPD